jgi:hypothetical protein
MSRSMRRNDDGLMNIDKYKTLKLKRKNKRTRHGDIDADMERNFMPAGKKMVKFPHRS